MYNLSNIKTIAEKKGMTIKSLLAKIKITSPGFYKSLETNSMNIKTVSLIAEVLGVSISELVGEKALSNGARNSLLESPVEIYGPPSDLASCYKTMFEQQKEIAELNKEIAELKLEIERIKNATVPGKDALAG